MFVNDYRHETSDISGWYCSGQLACFPAWNSYLEKSLLLHILWWKITACNMNAFFLLRTKELKRTCITLSSLRLFISGLLFYLALNTCHFIFSKMLCMWLSFSHVCFCVAWLVIWFHDIWKFGYDASWQKLLMTKKFVMVYSCNFVMSLIKPWHYCQYQQEMNSDSRWSYNQRQLRHVYFTYGFWSKKKFWRTVRAPGLPWWLSSERICPQCRGPGFDPCVGQIPWRRTWQPTPAFLPGKSHGQRSLVVYSPWGFRESGTT